MRQVPIPLQHSRIAKEWFHHFQPFAISDLNDLTKGCGGSYRPDAQNLFSERREQASSRSPSVTLGGSFFVGGFMHCIFWVLPVLGSLPVYIWPFLPGTSFVSSSVRMSLQSSYGIVVAPLMSATAPDTMATAINATRILILFSLWNLRFVQNHTPE